jgi:acyl carrier protein
MTRDEILSRLSSIFREVFDRDDLELTRNTSADDIEQWDSMNHVILIVAVEMRFDIKFQTAEIEELKNVGELVDLIFAKTNRQS